MNKLVSVQEMQMIEHEANANGLSYSQMMDNAGRGVAETVISDFPALKERKVLALVGSGNNGGDALVALDYLCKYGWDVHAYLASPRQVDDPLIIELAESGGRIYERDLDARFNVLDSLIKDCSILLDGVLGTGFHLPLRKDLANLLLHVRSSLSGLSLQPKVIAIDCPSGVDCELGMVSEECIRADITITMGAVKNGLLRFPAADYIGEIRVVSIGDIDRLPGWQKIQRYVSSLESVRKLLPSRPRFAHKGTFGNALVIAGSANYTGAAYLAGEAAYRAGAGLVTLAVPDMIYPILSCQLPEAIWLLLPSASGFIAESATILVEKAIGNANALLIGPGFGIENSTGSFMAELFRGSAKYYRYEKGSTAPMMEVSLKLKKKTTPTIIDADGLKLLSKILDWHQFLPEKSILTPHPGEMAALTGLSRDEIQSDRIAVAEKFSNLWGHIVVLKGAFTVVAAPDRQTIVIPVATPALARAGTGDVLAGIILGLRAQGLDAFSSAIAGAQIHAEAGLRAQKLMGNSAAVLARDVMGRIQSVLADLYNGD
jgi:NAD(P)H-hydrate epimerase